MYSILGFKEMVYLVHMKLSSQNSFFIYQVRLISGENKLNYQYY